MHTCMGMGMGMASAHVPMCMRWGLGAARGGGQHLVLLG